MKSKMSKGGSSTPSWTQMAPAKKKIRTEIAVPVEYMERVQSHLRHNVDLRWDRIDGRKELRTLECRTCAVTITIPREEN